MSKKGLHLFVGLMGVALLLTACSNESGTTIEPSVNEKNLAMEVSNKPTELTFFTTTANAPLETFMADYGDLIQKRFPNYTIKYVRMEKGSIASLQDLITSGNMNIDIMIGSIGLTQTTIIDFDLQNDISDLIKKYNFDLNRLEPTSVEIQRQLANGGIYGLPFTTSTNAVFYNKDLYDRFGQPYPKDGMTWDELYELARRMTRTQDGVSYKGLTMAFNSILNLNQSSIPLVDPKTSKVALTSDSFKREFTNLSRFYQIPGNEYKSDQQNPFIKDKTVSMYLTLTRAAATVFKDLMNWDVVRQPYFQDKLGVGPQSYPYYFYLTKVSKNRDAAFQVLAYVTSDEFQEHMMKQGFDSILKDPSKLMSKFGANTNYYTNKNLKAFIPEKYAQPVLLTGYESIVGKEWTQALVDVVTTGMDVNTALRNAAERSDKAIDAAKAAK